MNKKKKILVLGANYETIPLIESAQKMGFEVFVTDYNPISPAKKIADKAYDIDCMDLDSLEKLCTNQKIDGIVLGVADSLVRVYQQLCERLNYHCYATKEQSEVLSNKLLFNRYCKKQNIPIIPNYQIDFKNLGKETEIEFPVLVKPVDGNSGKGISICYNKNELKKAIERAKRFSRTGEYLVEKYMQSDDMLIYFTFQNGEYYVSAIADRFTIKQGKNGSRVCVGALYPSKYTDLYFETLHGKLTNLFHALEIRNGILLISAFVENNKFYFYDPGFRLQGEAPEIHLKKALGYDQHRTVINFAVTGNWEEFHDFDKINASFQNKIHCTIWILLEPGKIKSIVGIEELQKNSHVFHYLQRFFEGDVVRVDEIGTERQVFMRIYCFVDTKENLINIVEEIENTIDIIDENNNSMKISALNEQLKRKYEYH